MILNYRGRFAPSPTGSLHLGSLYTAIASFLEARSRKGLWLLRIDDLDTARNITGAADAILKTLERFGLHWDETVFYQSQHHLDYEEYIEKLRQQQLIYPCVCSRKTLALESHQQIYPQWCRDQHISANLAQALRIKTDGQIIECKDELQAKMIHHLALESGDFIIKRKDNIIAYQFAVVVDDALQQVTHVIRGLDLLNSTPRQLYLQGLLGFNPPKYLHIPIIVDETGYKLSKQTFAKVVDQRHPEKSLFYLLSLLKQQPPIELKNAPITELLTWAIAHWQVNQLKNISTITQ
jgi:glutamyl-Q tRNA(Asp) synthetase